MRTHTHTPNFCKPLILNDLVDPKHCARKRITSSRDAYHRESSAKSVKFDNPIVWGFPNNQPPADAGTGIADERSTAQRFLKIGVLGDSTWRLAWDKQRSLARTRNAHDSENQSSAAAASPLRGKQHGTHESLLRAGAPGMVILDDHA